MIKACWTALVLAALLGIEPAYAAPCSDLKPAQGKLGYQARSSPDRCEGIYQSLVAGEIELISFLRRPLSFNSQTDATIDIVVPRTTPGAGSSGFIVARALPLRVYYRLDASVKAGETLKWPISEVVSPAGLAPSDLGIVGSSLLSDGTVFFPLDVKPQGATVASYNSPVITFRAPVDLDTFSWRLVGDSAPTSWNKASQNMTIRMGDTISFPIDGPTGRIVTLDIAVKPTTGDYVRIQYRLFIP